MARWKVAPGVKDHNLRGVVDYDDHGAVYKIEQDVSGFLEQAKLDRELERKSTYKKAFTIPDIIAIEINQKWGLDIHSPDFFHDEDKKAKLFRIIEQEYPFLKSTSGRLG